MAVAGSEDALPGVRDNFFTNLLLLGFNPSQSEIKHKIVFDKHMFDLPNKKGMEVIMQYLFWKLDEELCRAQFRDCWPVYDKKQEREFRKNCSEWIARISKETSSSDLPGSSAMVMGVLMSPAGERFYQFIRSFSTYTLEETLRKHAPDDFLVPNFSMEYETDPLFCEVHIDAMKKMMVKFSNNVNRKLQEISECHKEWRDYVVKLTARHRDTNKLNRALKKKLSDLQALQRKAASERLPCSHPNVSTGQYDAEVKIEEELSNETRTARMKKVKQLWKSLQDFVMHNDNQKKVIESILSGNVDQHMINAKELYFKIPEMLIKDFEELFQQGLVDNTYEEGKLNILSLLNLWNSSLEKLYNTLNQMPIRVPNSTVERKRREIQSIRDELAKLHQKQLALKVRVEENKEIHKLRTQLDSLSARVTNEQCTIQEQPFIPMPRYTVPPLNMSFLKATPLKLLQQLNSTNSPAETPKLISIIQTDEVPTVERVKKLNDSIQRHATASQKEMEKKMEIPSLLTMHATQQRLPPVLTNKTDIRTIRKRIEYYSDSDDEDDEDDGHNLDDSLPMSTPELQLLSSPATPSNCDKSDITMKFSSSPSPRDPQDILADKIASYVVASSDEYSPDPKLYYEATSTDEEMSQEETEREENQTVVSMTELQCYSSSEEEELSDDELEWPVGETPDIRSIKARISQRRLLQLSRDEQQLRDPTMVDETSWLHSDDTRLALVPSTPQLNKTQDK